MSELKQMLDRAARLKNQDVVAKESIPQESKPQMPVVHEVPMRKPHSAEGKKYMMPMLILVLIIIVFGSITLYKRQGSTDLTALLTEVGQQMTLPQGEEPTVATVTDPGALSGEMFFKDAQVGDKLLVYTKTKKAILYRPSEHRVIVSAPLVQ